MGESIPECPACGFRFEHTEFWENIDFGTRDGEETIWTCPNEDCGKELTTDCYHEAVFYTQENQK